MDPYSTAMSAQPQAANFQNTQPDPKWVAALPGEFPGGFDKTEVYRIQNSGPSAMDYKTGAASRPPNLPFAALSTPYDSYESQSELSPASSMGYTPSLAMNQGAPPMNQGAPPMNQGAPPMNQGAPPMNQGAPPMNQGAPPMNQPAFPANESMVNQPSLSSLAPPYPPLDMTTPYNPMSPSSYPLPEYVGDSPVSTLSPVSTQGPLSPQQRGMFPGLQTPNMEASSLPYNTPYYNPAMNTAAMV